MVDFKRVPVVDVHNANISIVWPSLLLAVRSSSFIGIDLELSGLGNRRNLVTRCMDDRYKFISDVAKSRSILAIGLSCFKSTGGCEHSLEFQVQTFNLTTLCDEEYIVEPDALQFLVNHGFDFNKQYSKGIHYYRGADKDTKLSKHNVRELLQEVISAKKPVVFHNGLVDLVFLYQNLYCPLPANYLSFIADVSEMFPGGIYDTKYIAEYKSHMNASYLEYVFRKCQRENAVMCSSGQNHVKISFCSYPEGADFVEYRHCKLPENLHQPNDAIQSHTHVEFCKQYANHGWCSRGVCCPSSHDPDIILDNEHFQKHKRKRKRNRKRKLDEKHDGNSDGSTITNEESMDTNEINVENEEKDDKKKEHTTGKKERIENNNGSVLMNDNYMDTKKLQGEKFVENTVSTSIDNKHVLQIDKGNEKMNNASLTVIESKSEVNSEPKTTVEDGSRDCNIKNKNKFENNKAGKHRAGFDAFMTGFTLAFFIVRYGDWLDSLVSNTKDDECNFGSQVKLESVANRLYLSGKSVPLLVDKSHFSKTSSHHRDKIQKLCPPKFKHVTEVVLESKGIC